MTAEEGLKSSIASLRISFVCSKQSFPMKKSCIILILLSLTACAAKEPAFDYKASFNQAEENMQKKDFEQARKDYQSIQEKSPDKTYDPVLMLRIADTYFGEKNYSEAQVEYQNFLNYHTMNRDAAYAQYQIAMCNYNELTSIDRDPVPAHNVIREMRKLMEKYPKSPYRDEGNKYISICQDRLAQYELYVAKFYFKKDSYKASAGRLEKLLKTYPGSSVEDDALYYAGLAYVELGEREKARSKFEALAQQFPDKKKTAEAHIQKLQKP
jgi:outer membrane protein assembly factor BamD